jgi:hypothetical protein
LGAHWKHGRDYGCSLGFVKENKYQRKFSENILKMCNISTKKKDVKN